MTAIETLWKVYVCQYALPTVFVLGFPYFGIFMALYPLEGGLSRFHPGLLLGNGFSWVATLLLIAWAVASLKVPSKKFRGPVTTFGQVPVYSANGFDFYCWTLASYALLVYLWPSLAVGVYLNMPQILGNLFLVALVLCVYLWYKGKMRPTYREKRPEKLPVIFEFYRGMEVHPRIFDLDVKQLTNCRVGLMAWQLLVVSCWVAGWEDYGFNWGLTVNALLQTVYLAKFYWWETGYFDTLDITHDRAGFYICCGCLAIVPTIYAHSTYYFVSHPPALGALASDCVLAFGLLCIYLNYQVDRQKELFRETKGRCLIMGRKPQFIVATYQTATGKTKTTQLLTSGFWGLARHTNYVFELLAALSWNLPGWDMGPGPFVYNYFLTILLIHRIYRDEEKCQKKYGAAWDRYCQAVPYRLVPYIY